MPDFRTEEEALNSFILGDNLEVTKSMLDFWKGKMDLVYLDPPFYGKKISYE